MAVKKNREQRSIDASPLLSIVVPTYRRPHDLSKLLEALNLQKFPRDKFEVVIVDDGGGIPLDEVIAPFRQRLAITLVSQKNTGPGGARNYGAALAIGSILVFTDDDCRPAPEWLKAIADALDKKSEALCGGRTCNALVDNPFDQATQALTDYVYNEYRPVDNVGAFFLTNNLAILRKDFLQMEGFDPDMRFGEDREFCRRWVGRGGSLVFVPKALVYHCRRLTFSSFLRLHYRYGGGTVQFKMRCSRKDMRPAMLSPPSYYGKLVLSGLKKKGNIRGWKISLLLLVSQIVYAAGYARHAGKILLNKEQR